MNIVPVLFGDLFDRLERPDPGVDEQHIDVTELCGKLGEQLPDLAQIADVRADGQRAMPNLLGRAAQGVLRAPGDDHVRPFLREAARRAQADAAVAPDDDDVLGAETVAH